MNNEYITLDWRPELDRPVLIAAFQGWNDAGDAASVALRTFGESWSTKRFGGFNPEEFYDFQSTRPQIKFAEGVTRRIEWPENTLSVTTPNAAGAGSLGRSVILLSGPEPNYRWRTFAETLTQLAKELGAEMVVTLGALLADVPHSRPVAVSALSQDLSLTEGLSLSASRYEGPTGITGVLHTYCAQAGLPSVSVWAPVPHYLASVPSGPAALALLNTVSGLLKIGVDTEELERSAQEYQDQVAAAVSQDSDLASYVQMLEERYDTQTEEGPRDLPSGEELAQELEGFLRERREDGED